jgi:hypothetical protein
LPLNFASEYAITRIQVTQDGLKLNGTDQFVVYADDDSTFGGSIHTVQRDTKLWESLEKRSVWK